MSLINLFIHSIIINRYGKRVAQEYTWDKICGQYEKVFMEADKKR